MKVLAIAHNCVGVSNRRKFDALASFPDLDITVLTPQWWFEEGRRQRQSGWSESYRLVVGRTCFTNNGTRHFYLSQLAGLIARGQPDVIDLHEEPFSAVAVQTALLRNLLAPRAALIFCSYVNLVRRWRWPYRWFERVTFRQAEAAYAPSSEVPAVLREKGYAGPTRVIPMGVDLERFVVSEAEALHRAAHAPPWTVGFLGRLEPVKGLPVLLHAMARLPASVRLVVAGEGPERPGLERLARELGLAERVGFRGAVPFEAVPALLRSFDVLVLPSVTIPPAHKEQFGRVLVEAMASGVPVVGSDSGGIPEVIGDAGLVCPEGDAAALAATLGRLLESPHARQELVRRGLQRAREVYAWPRIAVQYRSLYALGVELRQQRARTRPLAEHVVDR